MTRPEARLSVALLTRNRPAGLATTLRSLRNQDRQPYEIIVSDDSDHEAQLENARIASNYEARHVAGPRAGLYSNRNHAVRHCTGTHVRTMDDDHEFPPGHMADCLRAVALQPDVIWVMNEQLPGQRDLSQALTPPPQLTPRGYSETPREAATTWAISDGAAIYPREALLAHPYSEAFAMGAAYLELGSRLYAHGYPIRHLSTTYVIHHHAARQIPTRTYDVQSRLFAAVMHSFYYRRSLRNQATTVGELALAMLRRPAEATELARSVTAAVRDRRRQGVRS